MAAIGPRGAAAPRDASALRAILVLAEELVAVADAEDAAVAVRVRPEPCQFTHRPEPLELGLDVHTPSLGMLGCGRLARAGCRTRHRIGQIAPAAPAPTLAAAASFRLPDALPRRARSQRSGRTGE